MPTVGTLGVSTGRPSGQRPWRALSTDSEYLSYAFAKPYRSGAYSVGARNLPPDEGFRANLARVRQLLQG